ncbi:MAG: hypothetical protein WAM09_18010 [Anaerolineales bacterium]|jgi:hypothetical protein
MTQARFIVSGIGEAANRLKPARSNHLRRGESHQSHPPRKPRTGRSRRQRCDCGKLAVIELLVRVGTDPQYTVRLPLCPGCLALEQSFSSGVQF